MKLKKGDVHVWQVSLDKPKIAFEKLKDSLSLDEQQRAERFVFEKDRDHFIVGRGSLRHILSRYLDISASALEFTYGEHGKPFLAPPFPLSLLQFNISHSKGLALYAVTLNQPVGIDVELLSRELNGMELAKRFFHPKEFQALSKLPEHLQQQSFFHYWVLKEAVIKAMGNGLFLSLDEFVVSHLPNKTAELLEVEGSTNKAANWTVCSLEVKKDYVMALAVLGKINALEVFEVTDWPIKNTLL